MQFIPKVIWFSIYSVLWIRSTRPARDTEYSYLAYSNICLSHKSNQSYVQCSLLRFRTNKSINLCIILLMPTFYLPNLGRCTIKQNSPLESIDVNHAKSNQNWHTPVVLCHISVVILCYIINSDVAFLVCYPGPVLFYIWICMLSWYVGQS